MARTAAVVLTPKQQAAKIKDRIDYISAKAHNLIEQLRKLEKEVIALDKNIAA